MKKLLLLILIASSSLYSQSNDSISKNEWIVKWNVLSAIDYLSFPTIQLGAEKKLGDFFSIQLEYGHQLYNISRREADTLSLSTTGFRVVGEARFYFVKFIYRDDNFTPDLVNTFVGLQPFYRQNQYNNRVNYTQMGSGLEYIDDFGVRKKVSGLNLTIGSQFAIDRKLFAEPYFSIGVLHRDIENVDRVYDPDQDFNVEDSFHLDFTETNDFQERSGAAFNFSVGIRLCYQL